MYIEHYGKYIIIMVSINATKIFNKKEIKMDKKEQYTQMSHEELVERFIELEKRVSRGDKFLPGDKVWVVQFISPSYGEEKRGNHTIRYEIPNAIVARGTITGREPYLRNQPYEQRQNLEGPPYNVTVIYETNNRPDGTYRRLYEREIFCDKDAADKACELEIAADRQLKMYSAFFNYAQDIILHKNKLPLQSKNEIEETAYRNCARWYLGVSRDKIATLDADIKLRLEDLNADVSADSKFNLLCVLYHHISEFDRRVDLVNQLIGRYGNKLLEPDPVAIPNKQEVYFNKSYVKTIDVDTKINEWKQKYNAYLQKCMFKCPSDKND